MASRRRLNDGIAERLSPQPGAIEAAVRGHRIGPEGCSDGTLAGRARRRELVGDDVGVDDRRAEGLEGARHRRLAAADPAGQPDDERHAFSVPAGTAAPGARRRTGRSPRRSRGRARTAAACRRRARWTTIKVMPITAPTTDDSSTISRQHLPAQPRAQRREQLEVAVAHAFLAADQLEEPVDAPEREVTRDRADHRLGERHEQAEQVDEQSGPQERQREVVGQELRVDVDERQREERPQEPAGREPLRRRPEAARSRPSRARRRAARRSGSVPRSPRRRPCTCRAARARRRRGCSRPPRSCGRRPGTPSGAPRGCRRAPPPAPARRARRTARASRARASSAGDG